jgi:hypothetical protein
MSRPAYRGLSIALRILSILLAVGGLLMIFSSRLPRLRVLMYPPESEVSTLLLFLVKELGGLMLMLCVMLWLAARDHARNVAILDGLAVGLRVLAVTPLLAIKMLGLSKLHPIHELGPIPGEVALAIILFYMRPQGKRRRTWHERFKLRTRLWAELFRSKRLRGGKNRRLGMERVPKFLVLSDSRGARLSNTAFASLAPRTMAGAFQTVRNYLAPSGPDRPAFAPSWPRRGRLPSG